MSEQAEDKESSPVCTLKSCCALSILLASQEPPEIIVVLDLLSCSSRGVRRHETKRNSHCRMLAVCIVGSEEEP